MARSDFGKLCDDLDSAKENADIVSRRVKEKLDAIPIPGKPMVILDGVPLPPTIEFTGSKGGTRDE